MKAESGHWARRMLGMGALAVVGLAGCSGGSGEQTTGGDATSSVPAKTTANRQTVQQQAGAGGGRAGYRRR